LSITVLCELRPNPGQAEAIVQRAIEQLSLPSSTVVGRRVARLYQHVDDPARLLYLAEWDSREAFEAYRQTAPMPGTPDQFQVLPVCRFYHRLALFERMLSPVQVAYADVVDGPAQTHAVRRDLALAYHRANVRDRSSLALLMIHETADDPTGLLIISGWDATMPLQRSGTDPDLALIQQLAATGATVEQFVGRAVAETSGV
jgi:quinol monooxygenase YgiN